LHRGVPVSFEWRTEEDGAPPWEPPAPRPPRQRSRRPLLAGLLLVVLAAASLFYLYRQASERIVATEAAVTDEVLASHQLVTLAAAAEDPELLRSVLSGADEGWARAQAERIADGMAAGHARFGLEPVANSLEAPAVTLDPEMRSAELTWPTRFVVTDSVGITQTVALTQTAIYRRGSDNWLLAPPLPDFWGGSDEYRGEYLEAVFAERDETLARRLAAELDGFLAGLCSSRGCPAGFRMRLILSTNPVVFGSLEPASLATSGRTVLLPTPTLVGLPLDEAGYTALQRGYARLLSTAVLGDLAEYGCCRGELYAAGWLHWQQHQLGLRPWPLDAEVYERLLLHLPSLSEYSFLMRSDTLDFGEIGFEQWAVVYAFAQFLDEVYHPALAMSAVNTPFTRLLQENGVSTRAWTSAFTRFIYEKSASGQVAEAPLPLPEAELVLRCEGGDEEATLRRLNLQTGAWQTLYAEQYWPSESPLRYSYAEPLGRDDGLVIISREDLVSMRPTESGGFEAKAGFSLAVVHKGITTTLVSATASSWDELPQTYPSHTDPLGRFLVLGDYAPQPGRLQLHFTLVDLNGCDGSSCPTEPLAGQVQWSPDGSATLVTVASPVPGRVGLPPPELYAGDARGGNLQLLEGAAQAAWLDATRYVYVTAVTADVPQAALVVRALPDNNMLARVPLTNLWPLAGETDPALPDGAVLEVWRVEGRPEDPHTLLVDVADTLTGSRTGATRFLVRFSDDWGALESSRLLGSAGRAGLFSGSGRWLLELSVNNPDVPGTLHDLAEWPAAAPASRQFGPDHLIGPWAPQGDWLPLTSERYLLLYNPSADYTAFVPFEDRSCTFQMWLEG
jgi:hypothetical protein